MTDRYNLGRFVDAQASVYPQVRKELAAGRKESHWMWFIFPQFAGLGSSAISKRFAIRSFGEARAYTDHPLLGARLNECTNTILGLGFRPIDAVFAFPDDRKFHSSMTLFGEAATDKRLFVAALEKFFDSSKDKRTIELLGATG
jgi:uncharacterized protein (DUF1810 family)